MKARARTWAGVLGLLATAIGSPAYALSLSAQLQSIPGQAIGSLSGISVLSIDTLTPQLLQLTVRGIDFPSTSTTPGFTYSYNPDLGVFERSSNSLGPALLERAETVGSGRFDIGASFLFADIATQDGNDLQGATFQSIYVSQGVGNVASETFRRFSLQAAVWDFSATYGLTDRWDVNVLLPIAWTSLGVTANVAAAGGSAITVRRDDNRYGLGDTLLRTKYRFAEPSGINLAGELIARLPTGKATDFQGIGDFTLEPLFIASTRVGPHDFHVNLGMEADASDVSRSRARYGAGAAIQMGPRVAFLTDILGSSGLTGTTTTKTFPNSGNIANVLSLAPQLQNQGVTANFSGRSTSFNIPIPRTDIVDVAVGFKVNVYRTAVAFVSAIVPLTNDGVRAQVVPIGGIEYSF